MAFKNKGTLYLAYLGVIVDQLPRLGKRELICLLLFTCNYVVSVWRGFLFLWVLGMGYVILLWHSLSLPYNYFVQIRRRFSLLHTIEGIFLGLVRMYETPYRISWVIFTLYLVINKI